MKYIVATSGGVDSVVLLDMLSKTHHSLVVAHFDHGIRSDSAADARFVAALAEQYGLPSEIKREDLGRQTSEDRARRQRYVFLRDVAKKHHGKIVTAHHADDLIETIAINLRRGTGWRGLAVFGDTTICRPFLNFSKSDIYDYALRHQLEWIEDETNGTNVYLRNRLRQKLGTLSTETKSQLRLLYDAQLKLKDKILFQNATYTDKFSSRYFFTMIPQNTAIELLRTLTDSRLTRPQLEHLLLAVKTARSHSVMTAGDGVSVQFSNRDFIVENTGRVL